MVLSRTLDGARAVYDHPRVSGRASGSGAAAISAEQTATFWVYSAADAESTLTMHTLGGGSAVTGIGGEPGNGNTLTFTVTGPGVLLRSAYAPVIDQMTIAPFHSDRLRP